MDEGSGRQIVRIKCRMGSTTDHNAGHLSAPINGRNLGRPNWANFDFPGLVHLSAYINEKNRGQSMPNEERRSLKRFSLTKLRLCFWLQEHCLGVG